MIGRNTPPLQGSHHLWWPEVIFGEVKSNHSNSFASHSAIIPDYIRAFETWAIWKNCGKSNFSEQFRKLINHHNRIDYSLDIMRQTVCLVINPIIVDGYASLFNCTMAIRASDSGWGLTICLWLGPPWFNYRVSFTLSHSRISHEYLSLFIIMMNLIFIFSLWCIDWVGSLYVNRIFMFFCIKSYIGTQG